MVVFEAQFEDRVWLLYHGAHHLVAATLEHNLRHVGFFLSVLGNDFLFLNFNMRNQSTCFLSLISLLCGVDSGVIVDEWKL